MSNLSLPAPAHFGPVQIHRFHDEPHEKHLQAIICFVNAGGTVSITQRILFENNRAENGQQLVDDALRWATPFVRERWTRVEVSTPTVNSYGRVEGGYGRLLATREARLAD